ncbi:hypothetical protein ACKKBF_B03225 [Auxenochlorella protothecoides x Auxenochlorella symbiontica]
MQECGRGCLQVLTCGLMTYGKARPPPWSEPLLGPGAYPQSTHPADAPPKLQDMHGSPTKTDAYLRTHNILGRGHSDLEARYQLGRVLGRGADGVVREAVHLVKETRHACKTIYKGWLRRRSQVEGLRREVHILQMLSGHPHVASLVECIEDELAVHLVLELAAGGELLQRLGCPHADSPSEAQVARHFRAMARFLAHCHALGVVHRDVKLENFLLSTPDPATAEIKAADFGLSQFLRPGHSMRAVVGSAYYMAPEVLRRDYATPADVWSLGVVLHILLSGLAPFWGDTEAEVWAAAERARLDFSVEPWPRVSAPARALVKSMLRRDPARRPTAAQLCRHPWVTGQQSAEPLPPIVHERLKDFATMSRVRQVAMLVAEEQISKEMLPELYEVFFPPATSPDPAGAAVTCPGSRGLSPADIRAGLGRLGHELSVEESERMARTLGWGGGPRDRVPWRDFAVATLGWSAPGRAVFMRSLFDRLDSDASGLITLGKLARGLGEYGIDSEDVALVFSQADTDASGGIDFDEWSAFMAMNTRSLQEVVRHRIQATCGALGGH